MIDMVGPSWSEGEAEEGEPGEHGEEHRDREDQEDDRDHHRDLLAAARLHERPAALLADVLRLGAQDLGQRGAALDGDDDAVDEPAQARQAGAVGEALQRGGEVGARARVGQAAPQLAGQLAVREPADPVERADGSLARADGEGQQLGDGRELGRASAPRGARPCGTAR